MMNRIQIKSDNAVQSIIINRLEKSNQEYLRGYKTAYGLIEIFKKKKTVTINLAKHF